MISNEGVGINLDNTQQAGERRRRRVRKRKSRPEAEKIVREDGSVVIRRRSHKRRSRQPHKESQLKKRKRNLILLIGFFILCFCGALGISFSIGYHNSDTFKKKLLADIEQQSGTEIELKNFSVDFLQARAQSVKVQWPQQTKWLRSIELKELGAKYPITKLLGTDWELDSVSSSKGVLILGEDIDGSEAALTQRVEGNFSLSSLRCRSLNVKWQGAKENLAEGVDVNLRQRSNSLDILLDSGVVNFPVIKDFTVNQGLIRVLDDQLDCAVRFQDEESDAAISIKGQVSYDSTEPVEMVAGLESVDSSLVFGSELAEVFSGEIDAENVRLKFDRETLFIEDLAAELSFDEVRVYGFPFLAELSKILRKQWYRRPNFTDVASCRIVKSSDGLELTGVKLIQREKLVLLGNLSVSVDGAVDGEFQVGIPVEHKLLIEKAVKEGAFSTVRDGYLWETIELSGSSSDLVDHFYEKVLTRRELLDLKENAAMNKVGDSSEQSSDAAFDALLAD